MYEKFLEPVIFEFTTGDYYKEVYKAKQEYFEKAGVVHEDHPEFENRMCAFMDWYLFDRDIPNIDLPPMRLYYKRNFDRFTHDESDIYRDFCNTIHSIFELKSVKPGKIVFYDLFAKKKYTVTSNESSVGFTTGDIFEARIIPFKGAYEFSKGFCFHPAEVSSFILDEIKKIRYQEKSQHTKLIFNLAAMKLKHYRFQHIDIKHIYSNDTKF